MYSLKRLLLLSLAVLSLSIPAAGQGATGQLTGRVEDAAGAVVPGASVTVTNLATSAQRQATTGEEGSFAVPLLPPGKYKVEVSANGFKRVVVEEVEVNVKQTATVNLKLEPSTVEETVTVTAEGTLVQQESSQVGRVIEGRAISQLPLPTRYKFGTVGPPMPGCEVRTASDGEIEVRSRMMFSGYYKEPEKTAEVLRDGWLVTGDLGCLDADGFLSITGRKKELIVLSTGKKVAPALVENMIKEHHLVSHAYVHGDGYSYLVALVTLNPLEAEEHARARGLSYASFAELTASEEFRGLVASIIESANRRVSSSESVRRFALLSRDFQPELDEVTPTLKLKRDVVARNFADVLQSLYA